MRKVCAPRIRMASLLLIFVVQKNGKKLHFAGTNFRGFALFWINFFHFPRDFLKRKLISAKISFHNDTQNIQAAISFFSDLIPICLLDACVYMDHFICPCGIHPVLYSMFKPICLIIPGATSPRANFWGG